MTRPLAHAPGRGFRRGQAWPEQRARLRALWDRRGRKWSPIPDHARAVLLREYDSKNRRAMAARLGVPPWVVTKWATALGVARTKARPWTQADLDYLEAHIGRTAWTTLARHLGRTVVAVKLQAKRHRLLKCHSDGYTVNGLAGLLGVDAHKVARWIASGALASSRRQTDRTASQGGDAYYVSRTAVRAFIRAHPGELDLRRVDKYWFVDLAFGPPPVGRVEGARGLWTDEEEAP